jgi:hypothetical protein
VQSDGKNHESERKRARQGHSRSRKRRGTSREGERKLMREGHSHTGGDRGGDKVRTVKESERASNGHSHPGTHKGRNKSKGGL